MASWVHPGVRRVARTIAPRQRAWDEHNAAQEHGDGPLWVAIGDSTVVGVGASTFEATAAAIVLDRLRTQRDPTWRLRNLGHYGVKVEAVLQRQVPLLRQWGEPALVTVGAGSNDVAWSWGGDALYDGLRRLFDVVPEGTVFGTLPPGWLGKGLRVNDWLRSEAAARGFRIADVGVLPSFRFMVAADGLHPNDRGYRFVADGLSTALGLEVPPSRKDRRRSERAGEGDRAEGAGEGTPEGLG